MQATRGQHDCARHPDRRAKEPILKAIHDLQVGHSLTMPLSRPMPVLGAGAAELRIRDAAGIFRAFYVVKVADAVLIFHAFAKKTQKTPDREIELGKKRLKEML
jgi:phage-related protein